MRRRAVLTSLAAAAGAACMPALAKTDLPPVQVFKNPSCSCCGAWVEHMKAAGFSFTVTEVDDTSVARKRYGLPNRLASCHTAVVAGSSKATSRPTMSRSCWRRSRWPSAFPSQECPSARPGWRWARAWTHIEFFSSTRKVATVFSPTTEAHHEVLVSRCCYCPDALRCGLRPSVCCRPCGASPRRRLGCHCGSAHG